MARSERPGRPFDTRNLALVAPAAHPLGGVATWLDEIAPGLQGLGWKVRVLLACRDGRQGDTYLGLHRAIAPFTDLVTPRTDTRLGRERALAAAFRRVGAAAVVAVDVADAFRAARLAEEGRPSGIRVAMALHSLVAPYWSEIANPSFPPDAVIATNRLTCRAVIDLLGTSPDRVFYAPYGVRLPHERERPGPTGELTLAWLGRMESEQKNLRSLVAIVRALGAAGGGFKLLVAGAGSDRAWFESGLREEVGAGNVEILGFLSPEEVESEVYARCDALVVTSRWETGPIVAWEAMARGIVLVSSRYIGSGLEGSLVDGANCLLFEQDETREAVAKIRSLRDPDLRSRLAKAGRALVASRYSTERSLARWSEAIDGVLALPPVEGKGQHHEPPPVGRLDRWLGSERGEWVREHLPGRRRAAAGGSDWPFSYGGSAEGGSAHFARLAELDGIAPPGGH